MHPTPRHLLVLLAMSSTLVTGCVSVPSAIDKDLPSVIHLSAVQKNESTYANSEVRWGGTIAGLTNHADTTDILVVARSLSRIARPIQRDQSEGRFIARIEGFVEPEDFVDGREITVIGALAGVERQLIGQTDYPYPVVLVEGLHLWSEQDTTQYRYHSHHPFHHPHDHWFDDHHGHGSYVHGHVIFKRSTF
ncbi:MAG: Slp family lipoprotein [Granulosicoccus sp.]|nr:Slp family lipoprotein [Granulosicoccus sp.]